MTRLAVAALVLPLAGCAVPAGKPEKASGVKTLVIRWQRLVDGTGATCRRCASTRAEVQEAYRSLEGSLRPLGIEVTLEEGTLGQAEFGADTLQSNRIWIGDRPIEDWLGAEVGRSPCCDAAGPMTLSGRRGSAWSTTLPGRCSPVGSSKSAGRCGPCGGEECRTLKVDGRVYETVPAELVVKAGLIAAGHMVPAGSGPECCPGDAAGRGVPCCGDGARAGKAPNACCPAAAGQAPKCCE